MAQTITVKRAADALQKYGYRMTPQRMMILDALLEGRDHITAEGLHERVRARYPHISFSTVYRTLELLRDSGIITQTDLGGGRWQYHPVDRADHHHLICQGCGAVAEAPSGIFDAVHSRILADHGFDANMTHYAIFGRCANCR